MGIEKTKWGICRTCRKPVPAEHLIHDGHVFLRKDCPDCGSHKALVSKDARVWQRKREICQYDPSEEKGCALNCVACGHNHQPTVVFVDVTSRCNLNCPICIANIPGMAVEYDPPLGYFEKIFDQVAEWRPKPHISLFGGEPTVRKDLFEIIQMAKRRRLHVLLVTNGLALAEEEYCKRVCNAGVEIVFAFDGRDPVIYERMRGSRRSYDLKMKGIENMRQHTRRGHTWVCTLSLGLNDEHIPDYFEFAHENRSIVRRIFFIPLTEMWDHGLYGTTQVTTPEEVEDVVQNAFPNEPVEFVPAGLFSRLLPAARFFGTRSIRFAGAHPNCESVAYFVSDGERYRPIGQYLNHPVTELLAEFLSRAEKLNPRLKGLDPERWFHRWKGRFLVIWTYAGLAVRATNFEKVFKSNRTLTILSILAGVLTGKKSRRVLRKHTRLHEALATVVLPFEEWDSVESGRMQRCTSVFVYLDPDTERVARVPFCMWWKYRKETFQRIGRKYPPVKDPVATPAPVAEKSAIELTGA